MPIYEYTCLSCGEEFEYLKLSVNQPEPTCTKCLGKVKKQMSKSSFQLKGGGWYEDGYSEKKEN